MTTVAKKSPAEVLTHVVELLGQRFERFDRGESNSQNCTNCQHCKVGRPLPVEALELAADAELPLTDCSKGHWERGPVLLKVHIHGLAAQMRKRRDCPDFEAAL